MMNEKVYQHIYNQIEVFLPDDWDKLVIYLEYGAASYSMAFYVKENDKYTKCYDLNGAPEKKLYSAFSKIDKVVASERAKEKKLWSNMTLVIDAAGKMKAHFDYTDLSKGSYQYSKQWKKTYLV